MSFGGTVLAMINTEEQYDLIWSAGLFDYFSDKTFIGLIKRFKHNIKSDGEYIIGNFHPKNPSRRTMEFGEWFLNHRDETKLKELAREAGYDISKISIDKESEGINLFMRMKK